MAILNDGGGIRARILHAEAVPHGRDAKGIHEPNHACLEEFLPASAFLLSGSGEKGREVLVVLGQKKC